MPARIGEGSEIIQGIFAGCCTQHPAHEFDPFPSKDGAKSRRHIVNKASRYRSSFGRGSAVPETNIGRSGRPRRIDRQPFRDDELVTEAYCGWSPHTALGHESATAINYALPPLPYKTMATLTTLKKKIAALEAQVERATKAEMGNAIAKIRKIMGDYGVTVEHLVDGAKPGRATASKKTAGAKAAKAPKASKAKKPAKYMDPKSGATWSGLGRIPAWIAKAKNRDAFLIDKAAAAEAPKAAPATKSRGKRVGTKTAAKAARAASKVTSKKSAVAKKAAPAKKAAASGPASAKRASAKKTAGKAARKSSASKKASAPASAPAADASTTAS
jgi:DNA-binding protein H-NS